MVFSSHSLGQAASHPAGFDPTTDDHQLRDDLAYAYRLLAHLGLDDVTYTHLSARTARGFLILPFGMLFCHARPESLLEVSLDGAVLSGQEHQYNRTGYVIHGKIYQARQDLQAIFHLHTPEMVAVSAHKNGLMPLSQWALHFYNHIAYHAYQSLALAEDQGDAIANDLGNHQVMLMEHHGALTCGYSIAEAMYFTHHLQMACRTQCLLHGLEENALKKLSPAVCQQAVRDLLGFEENLGTRDWLAWRSLQL